MYKRLRDMLSSELTKIVDKGVITHTELELIYKLVDIIKDTLKIEMMIDSEEEYESTKIGDIMTSNDLTLDDKCILKKAMEILGA